MEDIKVKNAIALCHIIDGYEDFIKDAKNLRNEKSFNSYFLEDLKKISLAKNAFVRRNVKRFYEKHKRIIDTINEYSRIDVFLFETLYDRVDKGSAEELMHTLYEYLLKNDGDMEQILNVLNHIKTLGFDSIHLDETADFTKEEYIISTKPIENHDRKIGYLENLERIPAYGTNNVRYKSNGSHYKIKLYYTLGNYQFLRDNTIYLNSLLFDCSLLPPFSASPDELFAEITTLKEEKEEECKKVTDSVDLKIRLAELEDKLYSAKEMIKNISITSELKNIEDAICYMELELVRMKQISSDYDKSLVEGETSITEEILKRERNLRKSILDNTDID